MVTRKIIKDLFDFLTNGDYYSKTTDSGDNEELNRPVSDIWRNKIEDGLAADFKRILAGDINVEKKTQDLTYRTTMRKERQSGAPLSH